MRDKGLSTQQTLTWYHENRLASLTATGLSESYLYDDAGIRVKKTSNGTTAYYPFPHYEVSGSTVTKYYFFNGQRVAMKVGSTLTYLHQDHLSSTAFATNSSGVEQSRQGYLAYGKTRWGNVPTEYKFTGQKLDATGLYYFNARYYDPQIGAFISPDTLVPDPTNVWDYNRFAYARLNPMKYTDPPSLLRLCHQASHAGRQPGAQLCRCQTQRTAVQSEISTKPGAYSSAAEHTSNEAVPSSHHPMTTFTSLSGTTITLRTLLPLSHRCTFSSASACSCKVACGVPGATSSRSRTLPLT